MHASAILDSKVKIVLTSDKVIYHWKIRSHGMMSPLPIASSHGSAKQNVAAKSYRIVKRQITQKYKVGWLVLESINYRTNLL